MKSRVHPKYKTTYRVGNWREYERALVQRGDVTLWLSADATDAWRPSPSGRPGGQKRFSDVVIETALILRLVFGLPLRQTEGFVRSVLPQEPAQLGMTQVLIRDNPGSSGMTPGCDSQILKRDILGLIRDSRIRLLFAYRRARRVRSRLPPPPPSPADVRTPGSLGGGPEFFLWMPGDFDGRGRGAEKTRHVWSEVAPVCGRSSRGPVSVVRVGRT